MTTATAKLWEPKRTNETREIEAIFRESFEQVDVYRYNSASIRVRVIDSSFEGMSREARDARVEEQIESLPAETQKDIVTLLTFAPSELADAQAPTRAVLLNREFEEPSPSTL